MSIGIFFQKDSVQLADFASIASRPGFTSEQKPNYSYDEADEEHRSGPLSLLQLRSFRCLARSLLLLAQAVWGSSYGQRVMRINSGELNRRRSQSCCPNRVFSNDRSDLGPYSPDHYKGFFHTDHLARREIEKNSNNMTISLSDISMTLSAIHRTTEN